jgi:hypothetical protein
MQDVSRVDTLKQELDSLNTNFRQSRVSIEPNSLNKLTETAFRKQRYREEIKAQLVQLTDYTTHQEASIRQQLQEIEVQLEAAASQKKMERTKLARVRHQISYQLEETSKAIFALKNAHGKLSKRQAEVKELIDKEHLDRLDTFKYALKPLEDTINLITDERKKLEAQLNELDSSLQSAENSWRETRADLSKAEEERTAYLKRKEEAEKGLSEFEKQFPFHYRAYAEEQETKESLVRVTERKGKIMAEIQAIEEKIANLNEVIESKRDYISSVENAYNVVSQDEIQTLERMENLINLKCSEYGLPSLIEIFEKYNESTGFDIDTALAKFQFKHVEEQELQMLEDWAHQKTVLEEKINILTNRLSKQAENSLDSKLLTISLNDSTADTSQQLEDSKHMLELLKQQHKERMNIIKEWKSRSAAAVTLPDTSCKNDDFKVVEIFTTNLNSKEINPETKEFILKMLDTYLIKLREKEEKISKLSQQSVENRSTLIGMKRELGSFLNDKNALEAERDLLKKEFVRHAIEEKSHHKRFEMIKVELENQNAKAMEVFVKKHLDKKNKELLDLQRRYGDKAFKQAKLKAAKEVKEEVSGHMEIRQQKLEELHEAIQHWSDKLAEVENRISIHLKLTLSKNEKRMEELRNNKLTLEQNHAVLVEAEDDANSQLEVLLEEKKRQLAKSLSQIAGSNYAGNDEKKLAELQEAIREKEGNEAVLRGNLESLESGTLDTVSKLEVEENVLKTRLNQLQEDLLEIRKQQEKAGNLKRRLKLLEHELETLGFSADFPEALSILNVMKTPTEYDRNPFLRSMSSPRVPFLGLDTQRVELSEILSRQENPVDPEQDLVPQDPPPQENAEEPSKLIQTLSLALPEVKLPASVNVSFEGLTNSEKMFFRGILPLLEGLSFYKRFNQRSILAVPEYDPLLEDINPLENCGYGMREFRLNKALTKIEVRVPNKAGVESTIVVSHLMNPVIPNHVNEIIKVQRKFMLESEVPVVSPADCEKRYKEMKNSRLIDYSSAEFICKAKEASHFPLFLALEKGGRVEVVCDKYATFKILIEAINSLVKFKKQLNRLKYKIET